MTSIPKLRSRLEEIPTELKKLYKHMMDRMKPTYQVQVCKYLHIIFRSTEVQHQYPFYNKRLWWADKVMGSGPGIDIFQPGLSLSTPLNSLHGFAPNAVVF
jgi:hypothetical protein